MKEFQAFKDTLSNKALKAIYEESKLEVFLFQGGICSLTDCDNIFPTISFVLRLKM